MNPIFHVIKDPVHGTMQFTSAEDAWVKPFIDSPNFQRLRHIKQLGLGDFIFPGAVHSRFNHSLGCCYIGSQIAHKIGLVDEERQLVMIACLLHDIGHGPFSHAFEGIFKAIPAGISNQKLIRHEDWTPYFLADYQKDTFFAEYNRVNPRHPLTEDKFHQIANMIMHKSIAKPVLADIVSSQLDADRLDYLLRDSHFCGVRYGEFDFRWMLHCMAIVKSKEGERLGITHKGIGVVEHYLMARRLMTRNIYHSQKKLALEFFLVQLLSIVALHLKEEAIFSKIAQTRLGQFLMAANQFNQEGMKADQASFLQENYKNYKELCDYDVFAFIKTLTELTASHPAIQLASRLQFRHMPKIFRLDHLDFKKVSIELQTFKMKHHEKYADWQLALLETPHRSYSGEEDPLFVVNEQGVIQPLGHFSMMIQAMSDQLERIAFLCVDQKIVEEQDVKTFIEHLVS